MQRRGERTEGMERGDGEKAERVGTHDLQWVKHISAAPPPRGPEQQDGRRERLMTGRLKKI